MLFLGHGRKNNSLNLLSQVIKEKLHGRAGPAASGPGGSPDLMDISQSRQDLEYAVLFKREHTLHAGLFPYLFSGFSELDQSLDIISIGHQFVDTQTSPVAVDAVPAALGPVKHGLFLKVMFLPGLKALSIFSLQFLQLR